MQLLGSAQAVTIAGNCAYVATWISGLQVVDITDKSDPILIGSMGTLDTAYDIASNGSYAYMADGTGGLLVAPLQCGSLDDVPAEPFARVQLGALTATPNPARGATRLHFELPWSGNARLSISDLTGRRIRTLLDETVEHGSRFVTWDGRNEHGGRVASGIYLVRLDWEGQSKIGRVTILR